MKNPPVIPDLGKSHNAIYKGLVISCLWQIPDGTNPHVIEYLWTTLQDALEGYEDYEDYEGYEE